MNRTNATRPPSPRFEAEMTAAGLRTIIPASRNWLVLLFLMAWLGGWAVGELNAVRDLLNRSEETQSAFLVFWLAGWTLGGLFAFGTILWQIAGREVITLDTTLLTYRVEAFGVGLSRSYSTSAIKHLRVTGQPSSTFKNQRFQVPSPYGSRVGSIAFDYGARTIRIAPSLDEAEAKLLIGKLSPHLPRQL